MCTSLSCQEKALPLPILIVIELPASEPYRHPYSCCMWCLARGVLYDLPWEVWEFCLFVQYNISVFIVASCVNTLLLLKR